MNQSILIDKQAHKSIVEAIVEAEKNSSGEIRVHLESFCKSDPMQRAIELFDSLKMGETKLKNGVLIYIAIKSHKISIIGDTGINEKVSPDFWNDILAQMIANFQSEQYIEGICQAVRNVGSSLKTLFPYQADDINEITNEISLGE